mmetsp:Transcript_1279/g.1720  ORF Transcript_1279/g.1720 Transcript_1279/m.1720 type:complete len:475 (-) Transcript_1279:66-1490(-)
MSNGTASSYSSNNGYTAGISGLEEVNENGHTILDKEDDELRNKDEDGFLGFFIVKEDTKNQETGELLADPGRITSPQLEIVYNVANLDSVQFFVIGLIIFNSILMGVATFDFVTDDEDAQETVDVVDEVILWMFTVELIMNIFAYNIIFHKDSWRMFDLASIILSLCFSNLKIIRSFRIFRAFRLFGRVPALNKILSALFNTGEQMVSILFVLVLVFYIFGVMFTQLFSDCENEPAISMFTPEFLGEFTADLDGVVSNLTTSEINGTVDVDMSVEDEDVYYCYGEDDPNYWGELHNSFYSLFLLMNLEDWGAMTRQINKRHSWAWLPVISFILVSSFIMLNLVIAVLCDSLAQVQAQSEDKKEKKKEVAENRQSVEILQQIKEKKRAQKAERAERLKEIQNAYKREEDLRTVSLKIMTKQAIQFHVELDGIKRILKRRCNVPLRQRGAELKIDQESWNSLHEFPVAGGYFVHNI